MAALLLLVRQALVLLAEILGITQLIQGILTALNLGPRLDELRDIGAASSVTVNNPFYGNQAIQDALTSFRSHVDDQFTSLATTLGSPAQSGTPVTLPTTPPSGYGAPPASDVWSYVEPGSTRTQGYWQVQSGNLARKLGNSALTEFRIRLPGGWYASTDWAEETEPDLDFSELLAFDPSTILVTDATVGDWIARRYPAFTGYHAGDGYIHLTGAVGDQEYRYWMGDMEFFAYKAGRFGSSSSGAPVAPVWPGYAGVTYSGTFDLTDGLFINQPLDGVSVVIATVPSGAGLFAFGPAMSYRNLGALVFETDSQDREHPQNLGFDQAVYLPKSMSHSTGVRFRVKAGVTGAVYPFTIP